MGNPAKSRGLDVFFSRGCLDLLSPPVLRSHDSWGEVFFLEKNITEKSLKH